MKIQFHLNAMLKTLFLRSLLLIINLGHRLLATLFVNLPSASLGRQIDDHLTPKARPFTQAQGHVFEGVLSAPNDMPWATAIHFHHLPLHFWAVRSAIKRSSGQRSNGRQVSDQTASET